MTVHLMDEPMQQPIESYTQLKLYITEEVQTLRGTIRMYVVRARLAFGDDVPAVADDILNDVVLEALNHAHRFDPDRSPKAWLLGIATNLIRRRQVRQSTQNQREPLIRDLYPNTHHDFTEDDLFDQLSRNSRHNPESRVESQDTVEQLLSLVSDVDQQVIRLAVLDELNGEALAKRLGISAGAARVRLHRALNRLRIARQARGEGD